jgi:hypothetical protein
MLCNEQDSFLKAIPESLAAFFTEKNTAKLFIGLIAACSPTRNP